jgi:hypothetical protein
MAVSACDAPLYFNMSNDQGINGRIYDSTLLIACLLFPVKVCRRVQETYHHIRNWKK